MSENTADPQKWTGYGLDDVNPEMDEDFVKMIGAIIAKYPKPSLFYKRIYGTKLFLYIPSGISSQEQCKILTFIKEAMDRNGFASWIVCDNDGTEYNTPSGTSKTRAEMDGSNDEVFGA